MRTTAQLGQDLARGRRAANHDQPQAAAEYGRTLAALVDARRYPQAAKLFASDVFEPHPDLDPDFERRLALILDGIATAVAAADRPTAPSRTRGDR